MHLQAIVTGIGQVVALVTSAAALWHTLTHNHGRGKR